MNRATPSQDSTTFVLVHGGWVGAWCWKRVARLLRAQGHEVYTPTLTGLGERSHLLSADIGLATHVTDVVNVIKWEELTDIVLVGHSYGGMVISGVAERVPAGTIRSIVYLDAFYSKDGAAVADELAGIEEMIGTRDPIPVLPGETWGYDKEMAEWADRLQTPHPRRTLYDKLTITGARDRVPIRTFVIATQNLGPDGAPQFAAMAATARAQPGWRYAELECQHDTMLFLPRETAAILLRAIR